MSGKTIFIVILTALITVFLMLNSEPVDFDFLFRTVAVSKLMVIGICTIIGFIVGYLAGRPKTVVSSYDPKFEDTDEDGLPADKLSKEDRDYIS